MTGRVRVLRRRPTSAEDLLRLAGLNPATVLPPAPELAPEPELRLVVAALMELLEAHRERLDRYGSGLRGRYELFRCALAESSFALDTTQDRRNRAHAQRRLGELADRRGNVDAAIFFYELALRSWSEIGCRRRLAWLRRHEVRDGAAGSAASDMVRHTGRSRRRLAPGQG